MTKMSCCAMLMPIWTNGTGSVLPKLQIVLVGMLVYCRRNTFAMIESSEVQVLQRRSEAEEAESREDFQTTETDPPDEIKNELKHRLQDVSDVNPYVANYLLRKNNFCVEAAARELVDKKSSCNRKDVHHFVVAMPNGRCEESFLKDNLTVDKLLEKCVKLFQNENGFHSGTIAAIVNGHLLTHDEAIGFRGETPQNEETRQITICTNNG